MVPKATQWKSLNWDSSGAELHAGRAEYYYQPAGFAGRVFFVAGLRPALSPQQTRTAGEATADYDEDVPLTY